MQSASSASSTGDSEPGTQGNNAPESNDANFNSAAASQAHSSQTAGSSTRARKSRTQTKWPEDKVIATGLDDDGWPTQMLRGKDSLRSVASLPGRGCQSTQMLRISHQNRGEIYSLFWRKS